MEPGSGQYPGAHSRINSRRAHERGSTPGRSRSRERRAGTPTRGRGGRARMDWWGQASTSSEFRLSFRSDTLNSTKRLASKGLRHKAVGQVPVFTGLETFTLRSLALTSLHGLGVHPEVKRIYMQNNALTSFEGWEMQPRLEELHAEDNLIETLRGLTEQPRLEILWLKGNPVTNLYCYRLMCIAAVGKSLRTIDGEPVKKNEVERALALGPIVAEAIRDGWVLDTVPALDADYDMVLEQYAYFRRQGLPLAQWAAAAASESEEEDMQRRWPAPSPYDFRSSPYPSRPGSRGSSRAPSPLRPPSRSSYRDYDDDDSAHLNDARERSAHSSPHGILRRHGKNAASLRERLSGAAAGESADWAHAPVGERDGVPVRARVQVARLLDILTTESQVLEMQLERQLEAQLQALASVQARSSSRLGGEMQGTPGSMIGANFDDAPYSSKHQAGSSQSRDRQHHSGGGGADANGWSASSSPEVRADLPHLSPQETRSSRGGGGGGGAAGEGEGGLTLREKVERREAAARAQAMAAAVGSAAALNGDQKLVSLLQVWRKEPF
jgi:hypothetical protein